MTVNSLSESGVILGSVLDIVQVARGADMSSSHSASALLSFGTISVRGAFCCFCKKPKNQKKKKKNWVCDADCTSRPWYPIFSQGLEGVFGVNVPVVPVELDKMAAEGAPCCTGGVEAMIANEFDEVRRKL